MKIAIPSREHQIDDHFGHCEYFTVYTIDDARTQILSEETLASPEGCGCKSNIAQTLNEIGVTIMLAGNIGQGAVNVLNNAGIEVIRGCSGEISEAAHKWISGSLVDSDKVCHAHDNGHECSH